MLAETTWDTAEPHPGWTGRGDQYLILWVIAWAQHPDGSLVEETPYHGFNAGTVPSDLKSLKAAHEHSCGNEPTCVGNNVGFYKFPFHVLPKFTATALVSAPQDPEPARLGPVQLSSDRLVRGESVEVSTTVIAPGDAVPGATVRFYDGDPGKGGQLFDVERVAHIRANDSHHVSVPFRPGTCGFHSVFVVVGKGTPFGQVGESPPLFLNCRRRR